MAEIDLSHLSVRSLHTLTRSPRIIIYFLAGLSFDCSLLCILDSATMNSTSALDHLRPSNHSVCLGLMFDVHGNLGSLSNTSSALIIPLSPILSLISFLDIHRIILSANLVYIFGSSDIYYCSKWLIVSLTFSKRIVGFYSTE